MSEIDENKKIQRITKLLEMGGTMLANHHECGAPLFRYQGKIVCPVCDFEERKEAQEIKKPEAEVKRPELRPETSPAQVKDNPRIAESVQNKIQDIARGLEDETDLQRVKEKLECIELGIRLLKMLAS